MEKVAYYDGSMARNDNDDKRDTDAEFIVC